VTETSSPEISLVPQSAQKVAVSGLSVLHFGHFVPIVPSDYSTKEYQLIKIESN